MYVEFSIIYIYFLSNISIVLKPTTLKLHSLVLVFLLGWIDFLIYSFIHISLGFSGRQLVGFVLNIIYFSQVQNDEYINGSLTPGTEAGMHWMFIK